MASLALKVPTIGESITEATLGAWKHAEGDYVAVDEPLVEVESEKATFEVPSPGAGILRKILRKAGDTVTVGEVIAEIEPAARDATAPGKATAAAGAPAPVSASSNGNGRPAAAAQAPQAPEEATSSGDGGGLRAPPSARRMLAETGLAPSDVKGSGRGGRISRQDVVRALEERDQKDLPEARPP